MDEVGMPKIARSRKKKVRNPGQLNLFMSEKERIAEELSALNLSSLAPRDALDLLQSWQKRLKEN